jgi:hypothetical protein
VFAILGIVGLGVALLMKKPPEVVAANLPAPTPAQPVPQAAAAPPAPTQPTAAVPAQPAPGEKPAEAAAARDDKSHHQKGDHHGHHEAAAAHDSAPVAHEAAPAAAAPAVAAKPKKKGDALDDLLNEAAPDKPSSHHAAAHEDSGGDDNLPDQLGKGEIVAGMSKIKGRVGSCYDQFKVPGLANVSVTIGHSGSVRSASVSGAFSGTPTGSCVEKAVKGASFPRFKGADQTINYPFMLR